MKNCPYCAEEIQDAAVVCKHCRRDLRSGAPTVHQVQMVPPKKKTSVAAWGCLTILVLFGLMVLIGSMMPSHRVTPATSPAASATPPTAAPPPPDAKGDRWERQETTSKMDDSKGVVFSTEATNEISGWLAQGKPTLILRCRERKTEAYVVTGMAAAVESGDLDRHTVQLRFDGGKAQTEKWSQSTDSKALFAPNSIPFIRQVATAKVLRFGFVPFNANPAIAEFNVAGFDKYLGEIAQTCRWK